MHFKSTISILAIQLLVLSSCTGQSPETHSFEEGEHLCSYSSFEDVDLFATFNKQTNVLKIYNPDFKVLNTINFESEKTYTMFMVYGLSADVFNSDAKLEFIVQSIDAATNKQSFQLLNEDRKVLKDFGSNSVLIRTIGNNNYIQESKTDIDYNSTPVKFKQTDKLHYFEGKFRKLSFK